SGRAVGGGGAQFDRHAGPLRFGGRGRERAALVAAERGRVRGLLQGIRRADRGRQSPHAGARPARRQDRGAPHRREPGRAVAFHADTPKTPLVRAAWPDATPGGGNDGVNWVYALGAGWLKTGWYGGVIRDGSIVGFDPSTGKDVPGQHSKVTGTPVAGAIAFAV